MPGLKLTIDDRMTFSREHHARPAVHFPERLHRPDIKVKAERATAASRALHFADGAQYLFFADLKG